MSTSKREGGIAQKSNAWEDSNAEMVSLYSIVLFGFCILLLSFPYLAKPFATIECAVTKARWSGCGEAETI